MLRFLRKALNKQVRRADMAHSPFHASLNSAEKRSILLPDRRRIPARKAKCLFALAFIMQMWGMKKVVDTKKYFKYS